jgi:hypothetical protein
MYQPSHRTMRGAQPDLGRLEHNTSKPHALPPLPYLDNYPIDLSRERAPAPKDALAPQTL